MHPDNDKRGAAFAFVCLLFYFWYPDASPPVPVTITALLVVSARQRKPRPVACNCAKQAPPVGAHRRYLRRPRPRHIRPFNLPRPCKTNGRRRRWLRPPRAPLMSRRWERTTKNFRRD